MEELVDLPVMCPILDICRLGTSGQLSNLHGFKKLYLSAKVQGMGKFVKCIFCTSAGQPRFGTSPCPSPPSSNSQDAISAGGPLTPSVLQLSGSEAAMTIGKEYRC